MSKLFKFVSANKLDLSYATIISQKPQKINLRFLFFLSVGKTVL